MPDAAFKPVLYLKQNCPFCLKVRLFLLEAGMVAEVDIRAFVPGTAQEEAIRTELSPQFEKVSFPSAQLEPGRFIAESDEIIAFLTAKSGRDPADLPVYRNYVDGIFAMSMQLWKENQELRQAAVAA